MKGFIVTDKGKKSVNQDNACIRYVRKADGLYAMAAICDGMGGYSEGEVASNLAIQALTWWFDNKFAPAAEEYSFDQIESELNANVKKANQQLLEYGVRNEEEVGTTMSVLILTPAGHLTCQVGDTRVYSFENELKQITVDQSFGQQLLTVGGLSEEEVKKDARRHMILQCIGITDEVDPVFTRGEEIADSYLLCTDGFWDKTELTEMTAILSDAAPSEEKVQQQIELLKERNEKDNITAVILYQVKDLAENEEDAVDNALDLDATV